VEVSELFYREGRVISLLALAGLIIFTAMYYDKLGWVSVAKYWLGCIVGTAIINDVFHAPTVAGIYCWVFVLYAFKAAV
jgi:hypothetical protein